MDSKEVVLHKTLSTYTAWLEERGAELHGVHIRPSAAGPEWGLGVYISQQGFAADEGVLCSIPLAGLALTARTCAEDPALGDWFAGLLADGTADARLCIMLFLVVQKALGPRSAWAPYVAVLPRLSECAVPLTWPDQELRALRGTPLLAATLGKRRQLQALWHTRVEALLGDAFQRVGVSAAASPRDWVWSYAVVWSRLLEWPAPGASDDDDDDADLEEGLLPFVDCCNHDPASRVVRVALDGAMLLATAAPLAPATEVCISYGDKSNEELLFLYGFAVPANPCDRLLLHVSPAMLEGAGIVPARIALLHSRGLSLRWLLPDPDAEPRASAEAWRAALAAAHVVTMPAAEAQQAAAALEESTGTPQEEANVPPAVSSGAEEGASQAATCLLAQLLEERLRSLDDEPEEEEVEEVAAAGWGDMLAEGDDDQVQSEGLRGGMRAGQGWERGAEIRALYCDYYLASERRLCKAYLSLASQGT